MSSPRIVRYVAQAVVGLFERPPPKRCPFRRSQYIYQKWARKLTVSSRGKGLVFFLSVRDWPVHLAVEGVLAMRLLDRGYHVRFLTSSRDIPFCQRGPLPRPGAQSVSDEHYQRMRRFFVGDHFDCTHIDWDAEKEEADISKEMSLADCHAFEYAGLPLGAMCAPTLIWWLRRSCLEEQDAQEFSYLLRVAVSIVEAAEDLLNKQNPLCIVLFNGHFFVERIFEALARRRGIRTVAHDFTFRSRLIVGHNASVWEYVTKQKTDEWANADDLARLRKHGDELLCRWRQSHGYQGALWHSSTTEPASSSVKEHLDLDDRPTAVALTNINFESSVVEKERVFSSQLAWLVYLTQFFARHPEWQLVIRIHPGEQRTDEWGTVEYMSARLHEAVSEMPDNVKVVPPEFDVSSYALLPLVRCSLVYTSTMGMECVDRGVPVITAAHSHYSERGFTGDPAQEEEYAAMVADYMEHPVEVSDAIKSRLQEYVGWFFHRRLLDFEPVKIDPPTRHPILAEISAKTLHSGRLVHLESLCDLIVEGKEWW